MQTGPQEQFFKCMPIAENGLCGFIALKNSLAIFSVIDIILGVFYCLYFASEVIGIWDFYNINGPHYILTTFLFLRMVTLPGGVVGLIASMKMDACTGYIYYKIKMAEMAVLPALGLFSAYDMCQSYIYHDPCDEIFVSVGVLNSCRFAYLFYVAFIAKSFYRRIERGELILVNHGRSIAMLIDHIQTQKSKTDLEMVAVKGVAVAQGEVVVPGESVGSVNTSTTSKGQTVE